MSNDTLKSKIELLEEQIENLENSGHFTEKEIDTQSYPLRQELEALKRQIQFSSLNELGQQLGNTSEQMAKSSRAFSDLWAKLDNFINPICEIEVIDAEILTANHITA